MGRQSTYVYMQVAPNSAEAFIPLQGKIEDLLLLAIAGRSACLGRGRSVVLLSSM